MALPRPMPKSQKSFSVFFCKKELLALVHKFYCFS
jgi:hypothetical protein